MPTLRVLVDGTPIEEFPPDKVAAIRRRLSEKVDLALQRWVDNNFHRLYEEALQEVREGS